MFSMILTQQKKNDERETDIRMAGVVGNDSLAARNGNSAMCLDRSRPKACK